MKDYFNPWQGDVMENLKKIFKDAPSPPNSKVTIAELVKRETSHIMFDGVIYQVTVKELEISK